jgi:hypothetical protein
MWYMWYVWYVVCGMWYGVICMSIIIALFIYVVCGMWYT